MERRWCKRACEGGGVLWRPSKETAGELPPSLALERARGELGLRLRPLPDGWDAAPTAAMHTTWDDRHAWRGMRAAELVCQLKLVVARLLQLFLQPAHVVLRIVALVARELRRALSPLLTLGQAQVQ